MAHIVRHEPMSPDDREAIDEQVQRILATGASPLMPLCIGAMGALAAASGMAMSQPPTPGGVALMLGGFVIGGGGMLLAAGRRRYQRVLQAIASRLLRNASDAETVCEFDIEAHAGHLIGGDSNAVDEEWSGAVIRTPAGALLFVEVEVALQFPRDDEYFQHVPRRFTVRTLPTHELIRVVVADDAAAAELEVSEDALKRLEEWVFAPDTDEALCREIPAEIIE